MYISLNKKLVKFSKLLRRSISVSSQKGLEDVPTFQMSLRATGNTLPAGHGLSRHVLEQTLRRRELTGDIYRLLRELLALNFGRAAVPWLMWQSPASHCGRQLAIQWSVVGEAVLG